MSSTSPSFSPLPPDGEHWLEVYQFQPAWGLPSVDPLCIQLITFLRFTNTEYKLFNVNYPASSLSGQLPMIRSTQGHLVAGNADIVQWMAKQGYQTLLDSLDPKQRAEAFTTAEWLDTHMRDLTALSLWCNPDNYDSTMRPTYAFDSSWPLSWILPHRYRDAELERLQHRKLVDADLLQLAQETYHLVDERLGRSNTCFYNDSYTWLDAILYGHLALHLHAPVPSPQLANILNDRFPNLVRFCNTIQERFFTHVSPDASEFMVDTSLANSMTHDMRLRHLLQFAPPASIDSSHLADATQSLGQDTVDHLLSLNTWPGASDLLHHSSPSHDDPPEPEDSTPHDTTSDSDPSPQPTDDSVNVTNVLYKESPAERTRNNLLLGGVGLAGLVGIALWSPDITWDSLSSMLSMKGPPRKPSLFEQIVGSSSS